MKGPRRGVIYAVAPSPLKDGWLWCGTDDGLIWRTRDDGKSWQNVTPKELTPWSKVGIIEASHFDAATAYATIDRHRLDDLAAHVYRTRDGGATWTSIARGIPSGSYVNVVREDPARRGLLYAGTETGVFVSFDDGDHWQPLQLNLPNCSVRDISVRRGDVVIATHGRSFWVLDDVSPLRQLDAKVVSSRVWLFAPRETARLRPAPFQGTPEPKDEPAGENPPDGAVIDYFLAAAAPPLTLEIADAQGEVVRRWTSEAKPTTPDLQRITLTPDWVSAAEPPAASAGMHRFVWDLHYALPEELVSRTPSSRVRSGVWAPPGRYTVRLTAGGATRTQPLVVTKDPRASTPDSDLVRQFELAREVQAERVRVAKALRQADTLRKQIASLRAGAPGAAAGAIDSFATALEQAAGPPLTGGFEDFFEEREAAPTSLRRLSTSLARFQQTVESADAAPTPDALEGFRRRREMAAQGLARWRELLGSDLVRANAALRTAGLPQLEPEQ